MKNDEPPEYFLVVGVTEHSASRAIHGPTQSRIVLPNRTLEQVVFDHVQPWSWRVGDYKTRMRGWKTLAAAQRNVAKLAATVGPASPVRVYRWVMAWDFERNEECDVVEPVPVDCGEPDTGRCEPPVTDRGSGRRGLARLGAGMELALPTDMKRRMTWKRWLRAWGTFGLVVATRMPDGSFRGVLS